MSSQNSARLRNRPLVLAVFKGAITLALLTYLLSNTDLSAVLAKIVHMDPLWIVLATAIGLAQVWLASIRWQIILSRLVFDVPFFSVVSILWMGLFFNQTLPSTVGGDIVRIWEVRKLGAATFIATKGVLVDRIISLFAILLVVAVSLPVLYSIVNSGPARLTMTLLLGAGLIGTIALFALDLVPTAVAQHRAIRWLYAFATDVRTTIFSSGASPVVLGVSMLIAVCSGLIVFAIARSLAVEIALLDCLVLVPPVLIISAIPISLAGWGVRETAIVGAFAFVGIAPEDALALSISFGLLLLLIGLPGGAFWLLRPRLKPTEES